MRQIADSLHWLSLPLCLLDYPQPAPAQDAKASNLKTDFQATSAEDVRKINRPKSMIAEDCG